MEECFENAKNEFNQTKNENIHPNDMMTDDPIQMFSPDKFFTGIDTEQMPEVIPNPNPQLCEEYLADIYEHLKTSN